MILLGAIETTLQFQLLELDAKPGVHARDDILNLELRHLDRLLRLNFADHFRVPLGRIFTLFLRTRSGDDHFARLKDQRR